MSNPVPGKRRGLESLKDGITNLGSRAIDKIRGRSRSPRPALDNAAASRPTTPIAPQASGTSAANPYLAIGTPAVPAPPGSLMQTASTIGQGLEIIFQGLYNCSDMFLPLKTAAGVVLWIYNTVETVLGNEEELRDLHAKLAAVLLIVEKYNTINGISALDNRIRMFCEALNHQIDEVRELQEHSLPIRMAKGTKDAEKILKTLRNINSLCDMFQIDTQLHIEGKIEDIDVKVRNILQHLSSGSINQLRHEMTSYKTRHSSYGDPTGCMPGTREKILENLEAWALDATSSKIYWLVGMPGTGKSTISQTFCEILEHKNMLGASFFCSRAAEKTRNARLIIPSIAYSLAVSAIHIRLEVLKAITDDPALGEPNYNDMKEQFHKLVVLPIKLSVAPDTKIYKVLVIDALDECTDIRRSASLIRIFLESTAGIPLKVFIASRDEAPIRNVFSGIPATEFYLHEVEKEIVKGDIEKYLKKSLADVLKIHGAPEDDWPSKYDFSILLSHCGALFIYAATVVRWIDDDDGNYRHRFTAIIQSSTKSRSGLQTAQIDDLYGQILHHACNKEADEVEWMIQTLATVIFAWTPLSVPAITSLLGINVSTSLSAVKSLVHVPSPKHTTTAVTVFHASFSDFITNPTRCSYERCPSFKALVPSEEHGRLTLKCLELMNRLLKYNICGISATLTVSHVETTNSAYNANKIPEALQYACIYWASHCSQMVDPCRPVLDALCIFLKNHLLHWMECLSILGELQTGLDALRGVTATLAKFETIDIQLCQLAKDAIRYLHMNFECIQKHCMESYQSALVWIPKNSLIREVYSTEIKPGLPQIKHGLPDSWSPTEVVMQTGSEVLSIAFSHDGRRVVSGLTDRTVRIWNATSGEMQGNLNGHKGGVNSVAFSVDGSRVVSGSKDKTVRIWNATSDEMYMKLDGHTDDVTSVAFSADGSRVVSGSYDQTVRIWNATSGKMQAELNGHKSGVNSVAFSADSSLVLSGSNDKTVRIWNATLGDLQAELNGHTEGVTSVAFSVDCSQVVSGSYDRTVRIWNAISGEMQVELNGHTDWVNAVAFSVDGSRVVSGSRDKTVCIWNATSGEMQMELNGHTHWVNSIAFSVDGSRVVSGSSDNTVQIWSTTVDEMQVELKGHNSEVNYVAFSADGSQVVSVSNGYTIQIWSTTSGEMEVELKGNTHRVNSVAFSMDGSRVISVSSDNTVQIWSTTSGDLQVGLSGHTYGMTSVAFSVDGSRVVSGSYRTVRIWNATSGKMQVELNSDTDWVNVVAFSADGSRVISVDGSRVVSVSRRYKIQIWSTTSGEMEVELKGNTHRVDSIAFSMDGSRVISVSSDNTVQIWSTTSGDLQVELNGHTHGVASVAFSVDGSRVVSGSYRIARIWNATSGELQVELNGHTDWVNVIAFSVDGSQVVSGSNDKTVQIWDAISGKMQRALNGHKGRVNSVAFSVDSSQVVSGSDDGTVRIWDVASGRMQIIDAHLLGLPDAAKILPMSTVNSRMVHLVAASHPIFLPPHLSGDSQWILNTLQDCWIPPEYRYPYSMAVMGHKMCFGYKTGRLVILDMAPTP